MLCLGTREAPGGVAAWEGVLLSCKPLGLEGDWGDLEQSWQG